MIKEVIIKNGSGLLSIDAKKWATKTATLQIKVYTGYLR